jgi:hypothetical protein
MKAVGRTDSERVKDSIDITMEITIEVFGLGIRKKVRVFSGWKLAMYTTDNGGMAKNMGSVGTPSQMLTITRVSS